MKAPLAFVIISTAVGSAWIMSSQWQPRLVRKELSHEAGRVVATTAVHATVESPQRPATDDAGEETSGIGVPNVAEEGAALHASALESGGQVPSVAAEWLRRLPLSEARNHALLQLVSRWAEQNPAAALSWAALLTPDDGRTGILMRGFQQWARSAPAAASQWLSENEAHPLADVLICQLALDPKLVGTHPDLALQWSALLEEPEARSQQVEAVILEWGRHDLAGASDYIRRSAAFDASEKRRLLDRLAAKKQSG
jgi:hypothetical protein